VNFFQPWMDLKQKRFFPLQMQTSKWISLIGNSVKKCIKNITEFENRIYSVNLIILNIITLFIKMIFYSFNHHEITPKLCQIKKTSE
jgi:hypothetical protein